MKKTIFWFILGVVICIVAYFLFTKSLTPEHSVSTVPPSTVTVATSTQLNTSTAIISQDNDISTSTSDINDWLTYSNPGYGYKLSYPSGTQAIIIENNSRGSSAMRFQLEKAVSAPYPLQETEGGPSILSFYVTVGSGLATSSHNWAEKEISLPGATGVVLNDDMTISGEPAESVGFLDGDNFTDVDIYVVHGAWDYRISGIQASANQAQHCSAESCYLIPYIQEYEPIFNDMLSSFTFTTTSSSQ